MQLWDFKSKYLTMKDFLEFQAQWEEGQELMLKQLPFNHLTLSTGVNQSSLMLIPQARPLMLSNLITTSF